MRQLLPILCIAILFSNPNARLMAQSYSAMSYNIRYDNPSDGENNWHKRKADLVSQVKFYAPDILGTQEALSHMVEYLDEALVDYDFVGIGREDGKTRGEYAALFYRKEKFEVQNQGTFWLSQTPSEPSKGWDANLERICTYAELAVRGSNRKIWTFNTHFDHRGKLARAESGKLIVEKIKELAGETSPVILTGDFNAVPGSEPIEPLTAYLQDARLCQDCVVFGQEGTSNGFDVNRAGDRRIDYIFTRDVRVAKYAVFSELLNGRYLSDHHPVFIEFTWD
ncbi:MAG: endonuclease/exonuclease/phosphatase family protein [Bacteroidota bacterium]